MKAAQYNRLHDRGDHLPTSWWPGLATTPLSPPPTWPARGNPSSSLTHDPSPEGASRPRSTSPDSSWTPAPTGHTIIQANPVIRDDTLGLVSDYGLTYIDPDPVARVAMPDGEQIGMYLDPERTHAEFARFSERDADYYMEFLADWERAKVAFGKANNTPIGWGPSLDQLLDKLPNGGVWRRRRALSAVDVITHEFTEEHIQSFLLWEACQTFGSVDLPGSGVLPYSHHGRSAEAELDDSPRWIRQTHRRH